METIIAVALVMGFVLGIIVSPKMLEQSKPIGTLRIDYSDSDGPYIFLEAKCSVEEIAKRKHVTLDVKQENFISQN